jgi:hypothetical protein
MYKMICIEQNKQDVGVTMDDNITLTEKITPDNSIEVSIKSDKFKEPFVIKKSKDGFKFYEVTTTSRVPPYLNGKFAGLNDAIKQVKEYIRRSKGSPQARRDAYFDAKDKKKKA